MSTDPATPGAHDFTWTCPSCGRQVPRKLVVCRCGASQPPEAAPDPPAVTQRSVTVGALGLAIMVVVAVTWIIASRRTVPLATTGLVEKPATGAMASAPTTPAGGLAWPSNVPYVKGAPGAAPVATPAPPTGPAVAPRAIEDIVATSMPAVVLIESASGRGTGFFVAPDRVVTNAHVVQQAGYVTVVTAAGARLSARVATVSSALDLALVSVADAKAGQAVLPLGTLADVRVGEEVLAIGSPLGFQNTVTRGIVSAVRRAGDVALVQTDAAINPGNSGGPLLDRAGRVIAVTTMKIAGSAESLGFGVAADHVRGLLEGQPAASVLQPALPLAQASAGSSATDAGDDRAQAEAEYERAIADAARKADGLDAEWDRFVRSCLAAAPPRAGARGWFAMFDRGFAAIPMNAGCGDFFGDYRQAADGVRARVADADETARRAGVFPGTMRAVRARYRLDWNDR